MTSKKRDNVDTKNGEPASAPCLAHETDDTYAGYLGSDELLALLNELLEAERAGAEASAAYRKDAGDFALAELLEKISQDEARFCKMLSDLITHLGGTPSEATGHFYKRAMAVESLGDRVALLCHGQAWMLNRICEALPKIRDDKVHACLKEIAQRHEHNKASCNAFVGPEQASA